MKLKLFILAAALTASTTGAFSQEFDEDQLGAWYMYFVNKQFDNSQFGIQGDYQFRFWNGGSDLEQTLLRTGLTFTPKDAGVMFTLGYANIRTGNFGDSRTTVMEHRIYQEALFSQTLGSRFLLTHRLRYEQRWVDDQDFRTRYRYNLFINVPFNGTQLDPGVVYLALYNELFINGQTTIGENADGSPRTVQHFDRNRTYAALGYVIRPGLRTQLGVMRQTTANWGKYQAQVSLHHNF